MSRRYPNGVAAYEIYNNDFKKLPARKMNRVLQDIKDNHPCIRTLAIQGFKRHDLHTQVMMQNLVSSLTTNQNSFVTILNLSQNFNAYLYVEDSSDDDDDDDDDDDEGNDSGIALLVSLFHDTHNLHLKELDLSTMDIHESELDLLARTIGNHNSSLECLQLNYNNIRSEGCMHICRALETNSTLQVLWLVGNSIGVLGATSLGEVLYHKNTTLKELYLSSNSISNDGLKGLSKGLGGVNPSLQVLTLDDNKFGDSGICALSKALSSNISLIELNMSSNTYNDLGQKALAEALQRNTSLQKLCLSYSKLENQGIQFLSEGLITNASLRELELSYVNMTCEGFKAFSDALLRSSNNHTPTVLTRLDVSKNQIRDESIQIFAEALITNTSLQVLNLARNYIGDDGIRAIANALKVNSSLLYLNLSANVFTNRDSFVFLAEALQMNITLRELDISSTNVDFEDARILALSLQSNPSLTTLLVHNCPIGLHANEIFEETIQQKVNTHSMLEDLLKHLICTNAAWYLSRQYCHCFSALIYVPSTG
jgi:Ran GTPase-activating protein (RanGAP) involved in mRNA processing and transport